MSPHGRSVPEDPKPSPLKIQEINDGFILQNVTGVRTHIVRRLDGKGYDIVKRALNPSVFINTFSFISFFPLQLGRMQCVGDRSYT